MGCGQPCLEKQTMAARPQQPVMILSHGKVAWDMSVRAMRLPDDTYQADDETLERRLSGPWGCDNCGLRRGRVCSHADCGCPVDVTLAGAPGEAVKRRGKCPLGRWDQTENVVEYHRRLVQSAISHAKRQQCPPAFSGRGIVVPAGGICSTYGKPVRYFDCALTAAHMLRARGCELPIQFWFLKGELEPGMVAIAKRMQVDCVDAEECGVQEQMRVPGGWQLKVYAILHSSFAEVLHLDADNIVARDPSYLFDTPEFREHGAMFWTDNPKPGIHTPYVTEGIWDRLGASGREPEVDWETGQMVIDKRRCWSALQLTRHFADHADYWGGMNNGHHQVGPRIWYGDKTDFHAGWSLTGTPRWFQDYYEWSDPTQKQGFYRHFDPQRRLIFQHQIQFKYEMAAGKPIPGLVGNELIAKAVTA